MLVLAWIAVLQALDLFYSRVVEAFERTVLHNFSAKKKETKATDNFSPGNNNLFAHPHYLLSYEAQRAWRSKKYATQQGSWIFHFQLSDSFYNWRMRIVLSAIIIAQDVISINPGSFSIRIHHELLRTLLNVYSVSTSGDN